MSKLLITVVNLELFSELHSERRPGKAMRDSRDDLEAGRSGDRSLGNPRHAR